VRGIDADWPLSNELPDSAGVVLHLEQLYLDWVPCDCIHDLPRHQPQDRKRHHRWCRGRIIGWFRGGNRGRRRHRCVGGRFCGLGLRLGPAV